MRTLILLTSMLAGLLGSPANLAASKALDWRTPAEISGYTETPRYAETRAYFERLDQASDRAQLIEFGTTPEGRQQFAFVIASNGEFDAATAVASGKPVLLIQACIHAGENEGKDTLMALSREWLIEGKQRAALDPVIVLLIPIFNVDGHERFGPHHRINQTGPKAMGWRSTAQNLNLNRDFVKAEAPEMRAWLRLWNRYQPDLLIDMHNTDGADYQYQLLYHFEIGAGVSPAIGAWQDRTWIDQVVAKTERDGFLLAPYFDMKRYDDISAGLVNNASAPRYSAGIGPAKNRPALLLETHMIKDFKTRVLVNAAFLRHTIASIGAAPQALLDANAQTDAKAKAIKVGELTTLSVKVADQTERFAFKGYETNKSLSEISGAVWTRYNTKKPITFDVAVQNTVLPQLQVPAPAGYLIPRSWKSAITALKRHGIAFERTKRAMTISNADTYRFKNLRYATQPFESRVRVASIETDPIKADLEFPAGSVIVPIAQVQSLMAMHLLEPLAPDSLVRNGLGDGWMSRTEYAEPRVLEAKARELLAADPALARAFQEKLVNEPEFAADANTRLSFFYEKLPHYDQRYLRYPVARLTAAQLQEVLSP
jgi:hypothetical protein